MHLHSPLPLPAAVLLLCLAPRPVDALDKGLECLCTRMLELATCKPAATFTPIEAESRPSRYVYSGFYGAGDASFICTLGQDTVTITSQEWHNGRIAAVISADGKGRTTKASLAGDLCEGARREIVCPPIKAAPEPAQPPAPAPAQEGEAAPAAAPAPTGAPSPGNG